MGLVPATAHRLVLSNRSTTTAILQLFLPCDSLAIFPCSTTELDLSDNIITLIPANALQGLTNFLVADLQNNLLTAFPGALNGSHTLNSVNVSGNRIAQIAAGSMGNVPALHTLDVSGNRMAALAPNGFVGAPALTTLRAANNVISSVSSTAFSGVSLLVDLDLSGNRLSDLPPTVFTTVLGIRSLILRQNRFSVFPTTAVATATTLQTLDLSLNAITTIAAGTLAPLAELEVLSIAQNRLVSLPDGALTGPRFLRSIFLQRNEITHVGGAAFTGLAIQQLFIYLNNISSFEWMSTPDFNVRILAWKPQSVPAQCSYNVSAIDAAETCGTLFEFNVQTTRSLLTGGALPPHHVCTDEGTCRAYFGVASSCCDSDDACRQCAFSNMSAARRCVVCLNNRCYNANYSGPTAAWTVASSEPMFVGTRLNAAPPSPAPAPCPLAACGLLGDNPPFTIFAPSNEADRNGTDIRATVNRFLTIGLAYSFAPPLHWDQYLTAECGPQRKLRFTVNVSGPRPSGAFDPSNEVLINPLTGYLAVGLSQPYAATVVLSAISTITAGISVEVARWVVTGRSADVSEVAVSSGPTNHPEYGPGGQDCANGLRVDGARYDHRFTCSCSGTGFTGTLCDFQAEVPQLLLQTDYGQHIPDGEAAEDFVFYNRTRWAFGRTYSVAPFNLQPPFGAFTENPTIERTATFRLDFGNIEPPRGFFVDAHTAEMLIKIPRQSFNLTAQLFVEASNTRSAIGANLTFLVAPPDIENSAATGPNGQPCQNNGTKTDIDDGIHEFDLSYTCSCPSGFSGANCEVDLAAAARAASGSDSSSSNIAFGTVGALIGAILITLVVVRYEIYRSRNRPEDMEAMQAEILDTLGLGGASLSVATDEVGWKLAFGASFSRSRVHQDHTLDAVYARALLESIRKLAGLPARLAKMLREPTTKVTLDSDNNAALLRLKLPKNYELAPGTQERFGVALNIRAKQKKISIDCKHYIEEVSVAVPVHVPRELDRHSIERLGLLGEGNFGEVFKASIRSTALGSVAITAAIKTLKTTDATGRSELLKEAALMALFHHPNVVQLLGVVTVPRNMPALLVIEYCEQGMLLEYARRVDVDTVDTSLLLTFCRDVGCGMHYLSSRKIVHRDLAARNVLLDAGFHCKVSDFGMGAALAAGDVDSDYASNYIRLKGELPVRWSSPEVLGEGKYSRASDVWAFGILVYEVMSRGRQPYADFRTLAEVAERIKARHTLECPAGCPRTVHNKVMLACWKQDPMDRPGFGELCDILEDLGASRSDAEAEQNATLRFGHGQTEESEGEWKSAFDDRRLLGPSVHHISKVLAPAVVQCVKPPWKDSCGHSVNPPQDATIGHTVDAIVKPKSKHIPCPRDGKRGCAYVDTLSERDDVGRATALLSYTWGYKVISVASALVRWVENGGRDPHRTYVWICSLCLNQHRMIKAVTPEELADEFGPRVRAIGRILPMLEPWSQPSYLTRAWCLFELYTAIGERGDVAIEVILTDEQYRSFKKAMATRGYSCIDEAFQNILSENATATQKADLIAIQTLIKNKPGGFATLNQAVKQHLGRWFESHGAIKSSSRVSRGGRSSFEDLTATSELSNFAELEKTTTLPAKKSRARSFLSRKGSKVKKQTKDRTRGAAHAPSNRRPVAAPKNAGGSSAKGKGDTAFPPLPSRPGSDPGKTPFFLPSSKIPASPTATTLDNQNYMIKEPNTTTTRPRDETAKTSSRTRESKAKPNSTLHEYEDLKGGEAGPASSDGDGYLDVVDDVDISTGDRCTVVNRGRGTVRFVGSVGGVPRIGVELDEARGLNDGIARGTRYFQCLPKHGVFSKRSNVTIDKTAGADGRLYDLAVREETAGFGFDHFD